MLTKSFSTQLAGRSAGLWTELATITGSNCKSFAAACGCLPQSIGDGGKKRKVSPSLESTLFSFTAQNSANTDLGVELIKIFEKNLPIKYAGYLSNPYKGLWKVTPSQGELGKSLLKFLEHQKVDLVTHFLRNSCALAKNFFTSQDMLKEMVKNEAGKLESPREIRELIDDVRRKHYKRVNIKLPKIDREQIIQKLRDATVTICRVNTYLLSSSLSPYISLKVGPKLNSLEDTSGVDIIVGSENSIAKKIIIILRFSPTPTSTGSRAIVGSSRTHRFNFLLNQAEQNQNN